MSRWRRYSPFEVYVTTPRQKVSAKSFIGMFSLDFRHSRLVIADCTQEELGTILARCCGIFSAGSVILILTYTYGVTAKACFWGSPICHIGTTFWGR